MSTVIHVGAAPAPFEGEAEHLDGQSAALTRAALRIDEPAQALRIEALDRAAVVWPLAQVRRIPDQADRSRMVLARAGDPLARLLVEDAETRRLLAARCPDLGKRPKPRGLRRLALWAVAALAAVALIVAVLVPAIADRLARYLPPEGERALGETTLAQIRRALNDTGVRPVPACDDPEGRAALDALAARVTGGAALPHDLKVQVLEYDQINAFALPGGYVTFFSGLIDAAESPDEVAAVLAHEIGHVAARDPTRLALRSAGSIGVLGLVLGDFAGGAVVLFLVERLIAANYSQAAETAADAYAAERLTEAGIDPDALGDFFERLREKAGEAPALLAHFMAHPRLAQRIEAARGSAATDTTPALGPRQWLALRGICD